MWSGIVTSAEENNIFERIITPAEDAVVSGPV
jgi:hypothetical protein